MSNNVQTLTIIRGLPGSGKSTLAKKLVQENINVKHVEADMYFIDHNNEYKYNASLIKEAHKWCQETVKTYINQGFSVVVSNTFVKKWEMSYYINLAKSKNVNLDIVLVKGNYENIHNVPEEVIERMKLNFEE